jgi:hypothetical protein
VDSEDEEEEEERRTEIRRTASEDQADDADRDGRHVKEEDDDEENNDQRGADKDRETDSSVKVNSEDKEIGEPKKKKVITPIKMEPEKPKKSTTPIKFESKVTIKSELTENSIHIDPSKPVGKLLVTNLAF